MSPTCSKNEQNHHNTKKHQHTKTTTPTHTNIDASQYMVASPSPSPSHHYTNKGCDFAYTMVVPVGYEQVAVRIDSNSKRSEKPSIGPGPISKCSIGGTARER
jgi:hypothetical protein